MPPLEPPPSPGATPPETPPGSPAPAPQSGSDSTSTPDSSSSAANDPIVGADDNSGGDWGTPDTWAGGEQLSPEWEGFNAGVGTFFAGLDQTFLGGGVADGMQVWSNTAGQDMGSAQRIYVSAGTGVATFLAHAQLSDAGAEHDAVDAHAQSTGERVSKGGLGSVQLFLSAVGLGGLGKAAAGNAVQATTKAAAQGVPLAQRGINLTPRGVSHVLQRHVPGGSKSAGKSLFGAAEDLPGLISQAEEATATLQPNGNFQRVIDAGRPIGIDRASGLPTSLYTVITNAADDLVTAFPGLP